MFLRLLEEKKEKKTLRLLQGREEVVHPEEVAPSEPEAPDISGNLEHQVVKSVLQAGSKIFYDNLTKPPKEPAVYRDLLGQEYSISPESIQSSNKAIAAFLQGALPIIPGDEVKADVQDHPIANAAGRLAGLAAAGYATGGVAPAVSTSGFLSSLPTVARIAAGRMAQTGATFGLKELVDEIAQMTAGDDKPTAEAVKNVVGATIFGSGLGAVGSIPDPVMRIPSEAAYGFISGKAQGADNLDATIQAGIFGLFGLLNRTNLSEAYKQAAMRGSIDATAAKLAERGMNPAEARAKAEDLFSRAMRSGMFSKKTVSDFDKYTKAVKAAKMQPQEGLRLLESGPQAPAPQPGAGPVPPGSAPVQPGFAPVNPWEVTAKEANITDPAVHRQVVTDAVLKGRSVPEQVLNEYPEIKDLATAVQPDAALDTGTSQEYTQIEEDVAYGGQDQAIRAIEEAAESLQQGDLESIQEGGQGEPLLPDERRSAGSAVLLGNARRRNKIFRSLKDRGFIDYRGHSVESTADVADLAKVFRNPKIEQFQVVFVKGGKVVGHRVVSSGQFSSVAVNPKFINSIQSAGERLDADHIYFAHNHPSGNPTPSIDDINLTRAVSRNRYFRKLADRFSGHIVTDGEEYSFIDQFGKVSELFFQEPSEAFPPAGPLVSNHFLAAKVAKEFAGGTGNTVLFLQVSKKVLGVESFSQSANLAQAIKDKKAFYGADEYIIATGKGFRSSKLKRSLPPGLLDVIGFAPDGEAYNFGDMGLSVPEGPAPKLFSIQEPGKEYRKGSNIYLDIKRLGGIRPDENDPNNKQLFQKGLGFTHSGKAPMSISQVARELFPKSKNPVDDLVEAMKSHPWSKLRNHPLHPYYELFDSKADLVEKGIVPSSHKKAGPKTPVEEEKTWGDDIPIQSAKGLTEEERIALFELQRDSDAEIFNTIAEIKKSVKGRIKRSGFGEEERLIPKRLFALEGDARASTLDSLATENAYGLALLGYEEGEAGLRQFIYENIGIGSQRTEVSITEQRKSEGMITAEAAKLIQSRDRRIKTAREVYLKTGKILSKRMSTAKVKGIVRQTTGQTKVESLIGEKAALKEILQAQQRAADVAFKEGLITAREKMAALFEQRKETTRLRKEVREMLEDIRKVKTDKMDPVNKKVIDNIKESLDFAAPLEKTLARLVGTQEFIISNPEAEVPDYVIDELDRLVKLNRKDLTIEQLRHLHKLVKHHDHLASLKNKMRANQKEREIEEVVQEAVGQMKPRKEVVSNIVRSPDEKKIALKESSEWLVRTLGINQDHYDLVIESLAGEDSVMFDVLFQQVKDGINFKREFRDKVRDLFAKELQALDLKIPDMGKWRKERVRTGRFEMTRGERISFYMHMNNFNNMRHLLRGGFTFTHDPAQNQHILNYKDVQDIYSDLSQAEKDIGEIWYKVEKKVFKELARVFFEKNGYELFEEENYFRIRIARRFLTQEKQDVSIVEQFKNKFIRIGLSKGFLNKRVESELPLILEDYFEAVANSMDTASTYVGLEIPLANASKLLYNPRFRGELVTRYGDPVWKNINKALRDIAGEVEILDDIDKGFNRIKNSYTGSVFGLNPSIVVKQFLSYGLYNVYVPSKYMVQGFVDYQMNKNAVIERHKAFSASFRERVEGGFQRDVHDLLNARAGSKLAGDKRTLAERAVSGIQWADRNTVAPGMQACVLMKLDELRGTDMKPIDKLRLAYRFAEYVTDRTQPSFALEHRSGMSRGGTFAKSFTFASTPMNQELNLLRRMYRQYERTKDPNDLRKLVKAIFYIFLVIPLGNTAVDFAADVTYRKKVPPKLSAGYVTGKVIASQAGIMYVLRDVISVLVRGLETRGPAGFYDVELPMMSAFNTLLETSLNGARVLADLSSGFAKGFLTTKEKKRVKKQLWDFLDGAAEVALMSQRLPFVTPKKIFQAITSGDKRYKRKGKKRSNLRLLQ